MQSPRALALTGATHVWSFESCRALVRVHLFFNLLILAFEIRLCPVPCMNAAVQCVERRVPTAGRRAQT
jgi:hypothetical protein